LLSDSYAKEGYHDLALNCAIKFVSKKLLDYAKEKNVNIITVESATGGSILAELVKTPGYGRYIYGSFGVYDSDVKRHIGVMTPDVYTIEAAEEMALNSLNHIRAMIALSITGYTVPAFPPDRVGHLDIAIAVRERDQNITSSVHLNLCQLDSYIAEECNHYIEYHEKFGIGDIAKLRENLIKLAVIESIYFASEQISIIDDGFEFVKLSNESYDGSFSTYGEPSKVISSHLARGMIDEL
jgi:nicotinamide mononucleotide (NMN) deamidase PncC